MHKNMSNCHILFVPVNGEDNVVLKGNHKGYPYSILNNRFDKIINN